MSEQVDVVSISGGKDSLATALVCLETRPRENIRLVHANTDHEHPVTVDYLDYLEDVLGLPITRLRANFDDRIKNKRTYILENWADDGVPEEIIERAVNILEPTGNAFLDLCLWKGRFPSRRAQFCTTELKTFLLAEFQLEIADQGSWVWSWQGVRSDESLVRRYLPEWEDIGAGIGIYRPILNWPASATFEAAAYWGVKPNPLYKLGMKRVGCMPCINAGKDEIAEIAKRWPWVVEKIEEWEALVCQASKRGYYTFFHKIRVPDGMSQPEMFDAYNIRSTVAWANTTRGGVQYDLLKAGEASACSSAYGLCE